MIISLTKHADKPATVRCIRSDGSCTWQGYGNQGGFFPVHDLTHYALETELCYRHGFFGMIAAGRDINDFGPGDAAAFHPEAHYAELLAGLLTTTGLMSFADIKSTIDAQTRGLGLPDMALSEPEFESICRRRDNLANQWRDLPAGGTIELDFTF